MTKNSMPRKISGIKREEVTGDWRKFRNEERHDLCSSPNIIRMIIKEYEMGRACGTYGDKINACRVLVGEPEGKRLLGRPRHNWKNNIKVDFCLSVHHQLGKVI